MHLNVEQVQRILNGELDSRSAAELQQHARECTSCKAQVEEARREEGWVLDLLKQVDHPKPAVDATRVMARARHRSLRWEQRVAAILLAAVVASGVAYAAPGSPFPRWIDRAIALVSPSTAQTVAGRPAESPPPERAGISVTPRGEFTIRFAEAQSAGTATVWLTDGSDIVVRAMNGPATFTTGEDALIIGNAGSTASYEVELPRRATRIELVVGQARLALKTGARMTTAAQADDRGRYVLPLTP